MRGPFPPAQAPLADVIAAQILKIRTFVGIEAGRYRVTRLGQVCHLQSSVTIRPFRRGFALSMQRSGDHLVTSVCTIADLSDLWQHEAATGRPCGTLDKFLLPSVGHNLTAFHNLAGDADFCVVEGNGGLFDGTDGKSEDGSTAQVAKMLGAPVVLVLDPFQTGRSAAAMLKGYQAFDSELRLEAILLSTAADEEHARRIESALEEAGVSMRVLGAIQKVLPASQTNVG